MAMRNAAAHRRNCGLQQANRLDHIDPPGNSLPVASYTSPTSNVFHEVSDPKLERRRDTVQLNDADVPLTSLNP